MTPYAIVCVGGGPRASAGLRARFPDAPFRYVGSGAPYGVDADGSLADALRAVDAPVAIVVDPEVLLDPISAAALAGAVLPDTIVAPPLIDAAAHVVAAGALLVEDSARGRAQQHAVGHDATLAALAAAPAPGALDGRCLAAHTGTLRAIAPDRAEPDAWLAATAAARAKGVRLIVAGAGVRVATPAVPPNGDDPRRAARERAFVAHASPSWAGFAAEAAVDRVARTFRTAYSFDLGAIDSAPPACAVVSGTPSERDAFERMLRANGLPLREIVYANGADAVADADRVLRNRGDRYVAFVDARTQLQPGWLDALVDALERNALAGFSTFAPEGADARATVVAASRIPECERLGAFDTLHGALGDLMLRAGSERDRGIVRVAADLAVLAAPVEDAAFRARYGCAPADAAPLPRTAEPRFRGIASIVMLSWNAPEYTRMAVESIRAVTRYPHEILIVDNGSGPDTAAVLESLAAEHGVRVVYNGRNLGFGGGMNVAMAHARGDVVVILNNDVVVTEGWLEDMIGALELRRSVGCTAPRSNKVASEQQLLGTYGDVQTMHRFAAERRREHRGSGYVTDRVVGFCLCLDRKVIDGIGGFDPLYGMGNYEDDDLCVRLRGAGWQIFVCDDVFIHHFGNVSFTANAIDYRASLEKNWRAFSVKWGLPEAPLSTPYDIRVIARPGFDHDAHFIPLPVVA